MALIGLTYAGARSFTRWGLSLLTLALLIAACASSSSNLPSSPAQPTTSATRAAVASSQPTSSVPSTAVVAGKDLTGFDPCSVVSDSDLVNAITAGASDPSALGTITASHVAVDGADTGLPGAKACSQSWTTTDSAGRVSQGGEPVIVTFDLYSNLAEIVSGSPADTNAYAEAGAIAFDAPGDAGIPHLTKDGYLFRMSGNSDTKFLKVIALGIAARL
jgi:hypothetical protein